MHCPTCLEFKSIKRIQPKASERSVLKSGEVISGDICGPIEIESNSGNKYCSVLIDSYSRYSDVKTFQKKEALNVLEHFKEFHKSFERQTGMKIKCFRSDNGKEYTAKIFEDYLKENGIKHETTAPYSPAQNGIAERKNRTLFESVRAMLKENNLPKSFWAEATSTACYLQNRLPHQALNGKTPFEKLYNTAPNNGHLLPFGKIFWVHEEVGTTKLSLRARKCILIGYQLNSSAYR